MLSRSFLGFGGVYVLFRAMSSKAYPVILPGFLRVLLELLFLVILGFLRVVWVV